ncbi:hypothetical protein C8R43DRAFT_975895 [Mycena crocata]|nr:hypothetical protein C8R43DRAFT_975895 [Mycena crocata]
MSAPDAGSDIPLGPPPGAPDVTKLFGPLLIGVLLNTLLYGVMAVQAYLYYHRYRSDRTWFRWMVAYLVLAETANWVCDVGLIYEPLIVRYATLEALQISPLLLRADAALTVLVSTPIQIFIAWRVHAVTQSYLLPSVIVLLAVVSFGGGLSVSTIVSLHPAYAEFGGFQPEVLTWLVSTCACDVFLTASLVYSLWIRKTNIISTDSYINKIIRLAVQTGFITAAAAFLDLILFVTLPGTTFNFMVDFPLSKLYTNALISTLNARPWREGVSQHDAPNVLFEQTPGRQSFSLVTRPSTYFSQTPMGQESYVAQGHPNKYTLDISSKP